MTSTRALSFRYNNGGLNNQKLALLGLFVKAVETKAPIILPDLYNLDHTDESQCKTFKFQELYDIESLRLFASRHEVTILDQVDQETPEYDVGGWEFFGVGAKHIAAATISREMHPDDISCDFFRSLKPFILLQPEIIEMYRMLQETKTALLVIQMRIEKDWEKFSQITLKPTVGDAEDYLPSFSDIMSKVVTTLDRRFQKAYVVCDESSLPVSLDEIRDVCSTVFCTDLAWKSDFLDAAMFERMSVLERSILDFDVALQAEAFVGLTRSSFSNMVTFERYSKLRGDVRDHFIYNVPGPHLVERTDNGAYPFIKPATEVRS